MNPLLEQEYLDKIKECKENAKGITIAGIMRRRVKNWRDIVLSIR